MRLASGKCDERPLREGKTGFLLPASCRQPASRAQRGQAGKVVHTFRGHTGLFGGLAFSLDGLRRRGWPVGWLW
jgi:hypothetical protein